MRGGLYAERMQKKVSRKYKSANKVRNRPAASSPQAATSLRSSWEIRENRRAGMRKRKALNRGESRLVNVQELSDETAKGVQENLSGK